MLRIRCTHVGCGEVGRQEIFWVGYDEFRRGDEFERLRGVAKCNVHKPDRAVPLARARRTNEPVQLTGPRTWFHRPQEPVRLVKPASTDERRKKQLAQQRKAARRARHTERRALELAQLKPVEGKEAQG